MSKWLNYVLVAIGLVAVVVMARHKVHVLWVIATATGLMLLSYLSEQLESYLWRRKRGRELPSPFLAEVLLDRSVVATLSERRVTEMFWRSYQITPLTPDHEAIILNDAMWERGEFTFRDPASDHVCKTGFVGGSPPFIREGRIHLRALYFKKED